jgi:hypothetical protein
VPSSSFKRNRIINGNMAVAQRGTSFSSPIGYTVDRWGIGYTGSAPASAAQVAGPSGYQYALQVTGAAGNTIVAIYQPIESKNCADLVGKSITISVTIFCSTAQTVGWNLFYANSADSFGSSTSIQTGSWAVGTTAQRFTATINNLPAGAANGLQLNIQPNNFGAFTSGTITLTGVQLEVGTKATPYEMQIYSDQLAQCQRYYEMSYNSGIAPGTNITAAVNGQAWFTPSNSNVTGIEYSGTIPYRVSKRTSPTGRYWDLAGNASKISNDTSNNNKSVGAGAVFGSVGEWGYAYDFSLTSSTNARAYWCWDASAEL